MRTRSLFIAGFTAVVLVTSGCAGGKQQSSAQPTTSPIVADAAPTTESTPEPIETLETEPTPEPKEPEPSAISPEPIETRTVPPGLTIIVPVNTAQLSCSHSGRLPSLAASNGNDYPRFMFNAMCAAESSKNRIRFTFGQVGANEGVECGTEYVIDGNQPTGVAWWCPELKMLISSPSAILAANGNWELVRELMVAYAMGVAGTKYGKPYDSELVVCLIGRTIRNLKNADTISASYANELNDNFSGMLDSKDASKLRERFRDGYTTGSC